MSVLDSIKNGAKKVGHGLKKYLTDWKNLLLHGIVGVILLWFLLFAPIAWYYRVLALLLVIAFNICRMKYADKKKQKKEE